jgi:hypothetical protein
MEMFSHNSESINWFIIAGMVKYKRSNLKSEVIKYLTEIRENIEGPGKSSSFQKVLEVLREKKMKAKVISIKYCFRIKS